MPLHASRPDLSFVIPVRHDLRVVPTLDRLHRFATFRSLAIEIIVCGMLPPMSLTKLPAIFVSVNPPLKGSCVRAGITIARAPTVVVCDADLPVSDRDIDRLLAASTTSRVVFGSRTAAGASVVGTTGFRLLLGGIYRFLQSLLLGLRFDTQCGVKVFERHVAKKLFAAQRLEGLLYDTEIALTCRALQIPITEIAVSIHNDVHSVISPLNASVDIVIGLGILWFRSMNRHRSLPD
jgi:hypothetical protein